ncbi:MAG: uracil-DNA glycosylase family protein, partial [Planctomycetota bacterium]
ANPDGDLLRAPGGELLADIITKGMGLTVDDVQVACVVPGEIASAEPFASAEIHKRLQALAPQVIVTLGRPAASAVLGVDAPLPRLRGQIHTTPSGVRAVATYHPAYLTRAPQHKKDAWQDIQIAMQVAGIQRPGA